MENILKSGGTGTGKVSPPAKILAPFQFGYKWSHFYISFLYCQCPLLYCSVSMYNVFWGNEKENNPHSTFEWILKYISTLQGLLLQAPPPLRAIVLYYPYEQFLYLVGKKRLKFWNHLPSPAKIPAARTDHLLCADTNDLGEISAPRVRINNTLVGGILDFKSGKYIIEYIYHWNEER